MNIIIIVVNIKKHTGVIASRGVSGLCGYTLYTKMENHEVSVLQTWPGPTCAFT